MTSSNLVGCSIGMSAGNPPCNILVTTVRFAETKSNYRRYTAASRQLLQKIEDLSLQRTLPLEKGSAALPSAPTRRNDGSITEELYTFPVHFGGYQRYAGDVAAWLGEAGHQSGQVSEFH